jgi:hypothetical protein
MTWLNLHETLLNILVFAFWGWLIWVWRHPLTPLEREEAIEEIEHVEAEEAMSEDDDSLETDPSGFETPHEDHVPVVLSGDALATPQDKAQTGRV